MNIENTGYVNCTSIKSQLMLHIPAEKLPNEFKDEARLDSLYSPFRSRTVNPRDFDTKISSWKHIIYLYCVNNGVYSFTLARLNKLFLRHGRPPSCFPTVLEELVKSGDLQYLEDFLKEVPKDWSSWAANLLVKRPLLWSFNTVKRSLFTRPVDPDRTYVHVEVIEGESHKILAGIPGKYRNKVINFTEFLSIIDKDLTQAEDIKLLLHYLVREEKADMTCLKDSTDLESVLVKFGHPDKPVHISETDTAIYVLEQNEKAFTKHVEDLEDEVARCIKEVKAHLLKGHRQLAKTCLKKKREIEKRLTHKVNALHNIQVLLEKIKETHTDAEVWQSYKKALSAFNSTWKESGLTEDAVEDTMLKLGEMMDVHEDLQSAIAKPVLTEDDEDLEDELAELMKTEPEPETSTTSADIDEHLSKLDINELPDVPSQNVSLKQPS